MAGVSLLLALPDPCLLLVLQYCAADDQCSLFNASRAHSRLHQAAVVALGSITAQVSQQQQMDGVMVYLGLHSQHVNSLDLRVIRGYRHLLKALRQLPPQLQLGSLQLEGLRLQLLPGSGAQGVLGAAATVAALKQLRLHRCNLPAGRAAAALAAALSQLSAGLKHLSIIDLYSDGPFAFPAGVLQQLPHLTYLELRDFGIAGFDEASPALQPLQALTRLVGLKLGELRVKGFQLADITSAMLSGMQRLTCLELSGAVEPAALAGKTRLQHLCLNDLVMSGGAAGVAQLLSHLQLLQQLTHLSVDRSLRAVEGSNPPAAAYAAVTASSKLQHLDISHCTLPAGVWQHLFPTGRQLPQLHLLDVTGVVLPTGEYAPIPESSRLVSCCPGLQSLKACFLHYSAELLAPLQGLSRLHTLDCSWGDATAAIVQAVCHLTGLRELEVRGSAHLKEEGSLLQLTQLKRLSSLQYWGSTGKCMDLSGGDEPVWRQLARLHLDHRDPGVAQQAALADSQ